HRTSRDPAPHPPDLAGRALHPPHRPRHRARRARGLPPRRRRLPSQTAAARGDRAHRRHADGERRRMKRPHTILDDLTAPGAIRMEFQPIVELAARGPELTADGPRLYMLEALARGPRNTTMERPDVMFEYARRKGVEPQLDMICIAEALASF